MVEDAEIVARGEGEADASRRRVHKPLPVDLLDGITQSRRPSRQVGRVRCVSVHLVCGTAYALTEMPRLQGHAAIMQDAPGPEIERNGHGSRHEQRDRSVARGWNLAVTARGSALGTLTTTSIRPAAPIRLTLTRQCASGLAQQPHCPVPTSADPHRPVTCPNDQHRPCCTLDCKETVDRPATATCSPPCWTFGSTDQREHHPPAV